MELCLMVTKIAKNHQQPAFGIKIETETVDFLLHWNKSYCIFKMYLHLYVLPI